MAYSIDTSNISQRPRPDTTSAEKARLHKSLSDAVNRTQVPEDFSGRDLSGLDLTGCDLSNLNFTGANLSNTKLARANLSAAVLVNARLDHAEFLGAKLHGADFSNAEGTRVGFAGVQAHNARFLSARLHETSFAQADLTDTDFRGASLDHAHFREAKLINVDFTNASLSNADLEAADVQGAGFCRADLREAHLREIRHFEKASWVGTDIRLVDFCGAYLVRRHIQDENYLYEFRNRSRLNEVIYRVWWLSSDCGRSLLRWSGLVASIIVIFAALYSLVDIDYGDYQTDLSPLYYSVVTLTTLGYGDVVPMSTSAQILAIAEAMLGYVALGGLLSIFANKMARRAD